MKLAVCDLGSNTLKFTVADVGTSGELTVLHEDAIITRIGEGLDQNHRLLDSAMDRTLTVLSEQVERAHELSAERIACVATAGMRGASNADEFVARVRERTGVTIEIIDGHREAGLSFAAPSRAFGPGPILVFDPGGRSTELVRGENGEIDARVSMEIGGVRLTERFLDSDPPTEAALENSAAYIREQLERHAPERAPDMRIVGVSGTVVALLGVEMGTDDIAVVLENGEGQPLTRSGAESAYEALRVLPKADRIRGTVIPEGRADVIIAGAQIVLETLRHYGADEMLVTHRGVRYGLLYEMLGD